MLLSALMLAAALQAAPSVTTVTPTESIDRGQATHYPSKAEAVQAIVAKAACRTSGVELVDQRARAASPTVKLLGDLPSANHTLTVLRSVDGCPVSTTVRFNVDRPAGR